MEKNGQSQGRETEAGRRENEWRGNWSCHSKEPSQAVVWCLVSKNNKSKEGIQGVQGANSRQSGHGIGKINSRAGDWVIGVILRVVWSPLTVFSGEVTVQPTLEAIDRFFRPSPELQGLGWAGTSPSAAVGWPRRVSDSVFRSAVGRPDDVLTRSRDEIAVGSSVATQARNIICVSVIVLASACDGGQRL